MTKAILLCQRSGVGVGGAVQLSRDREGRAGSWVCTQPPRIFYVKISEAKFGFSQSYYPIFCFSILVRQFCKCFGLTGLKLCTSDFGKFNWSEVLNLFCSDLILKLYSFQVRINRAFTNIYANESWNRRPTKHSLNVFI